MTQSQSPLGLVTTRSPVEVANQRIRPQCQSAEPGSARDPPGLLVRHEDELLRWPDVLRAPTRVLLRLVRSLPAADLHQGLRSLASFGGRRGGRLGKEVRLVRLTACSITAERGLVHGQLTVVVWRHGVLSIGHDLVRARPNGRADVTVGRVAALFGRLLGCVHRLLVVREAHWKKKITKKITSHTSYSAVALAFEELRTPYASERKEFAYKNSEMRTPTQRNRETNASFHKHLYH